MRSLIARIETPELPEDLVLETRVRLSQERNRNALVRLENRLQYLLKPMVVPFVLGVSLWIHAESTGLPTPTGSIILVLLALVVGFQLCLQAIVLDIQATPR